MIAIAREKAAAQGVANVRFEQGTLSEVSLAEGPFDVVLAFNLLHLLEDISGAARRAHALLRPGGRFVSKTVCLAEQTRLWSVPLAAARAFGFAPFVRCLTVAELEDAIRGASVEIVETGFYPPSPPSRFVVARKAPA
jgi:2-polyprenyl-3-methyl-5-hydroxy-6-metoxy-1,4-benzoquinol methylase